MPVTSFPLPPMPIDRRKLLVGGAGAAASLLLPQLALAQTSLSVTQGNFAPLPIAIPNFVPGSPEDAQAGTDVVGVITNDLKRSGLFAP
ncbi:MAG: Tol-Pal system protein TolB, partial [Bradyrhizobium sp.]